MPDYYYYHHHHYHYYYAQAAASQVWRAARSREDRRNKVNEESIDEIDDLRRLITKRRVAAAIPPKIDRCLIVVDLYSFTFFASSLFPVRYLPLSCPPSPIYTQLSHYPEERETRAPLPSSKRPMRVKYFAKSRIIDDDA